MEENAWKTAVKIEAEPDDPRTKKRKAKSLSRHVHVAFYNCEFTIIRNMYYTLHV